jgi:hypothetical protein
LLPPPNLHAKIFAVKRDSGDQPMLRDGDQRLLHQLQNPDANGNLYNATLLFDVGLKGNEEKLLINSYAIFSGLKFKTTSYNHEGSPFYLVISIY